MKKISALIKYEVIDIFRGKLIWIIFFLYLFGVIQVISSMKMGGYSFFTLVGLIKVSWLPLNFIMIPVMLLSMKIGESENEIFEILDISPMEFIISKIGAVSIINLVILSINILLALIFGIFCRVSLGYLFYEMTGYIINTVIFLVAACSVGLSLGAVSKRFGEVIGFILIIIFFMVTCNFYKTSNNIVPLINIRIFPGSFDVISYDKSYLYHNIFWLILSLSFLLITYIYENFKKERVITKVFSAGSLIFLFTVCICLLNGINTNKPDYYNITNRNDSKNYSNDENKAPTFFSKENCGYYIDKYSMDIIINQTLINNCEMDIKVNKKISSMEFGLYEKLNISKVEVDGNAVNYKRTDNSFIVSLPKEYNSEENIKLKVSCEGKINTCWGQGQQMFFLRNNGLFLGDVFEWYPKLNDENIKEYNLNIKYSSGHKLYSNLNGENISGQYKFTGKDREIFLISGNISERNYRNYLFIGNEEYVNSNSKCDDLIKFMEDKKLEDIKPAVFGPFLPGGGKMDMPYVKACFFADDV
ncbi:MAG: hypothetical protein WCQ54_13005 [Clostridiaceae bacterium]